MKPAIAISIVIFVVIAIVHIIRFICGWEVTVNGIIIPMWVSVLGAAVPGIMAFLLWCGCGDNKKTDAVKKA